MLGCITYKYVFSSLTFEDKEYLTAGEYYSGAGNRKIVRSKKIITNGIILSKQVNSIISFSSYIFKLKNKDDLIRRLMDGLAYTIFIGLIIIIHTPVPRCCVRNDQIILCVFCFDVENI